MIHLISDLPTWFASLTHWSVMPWADLAQTTYDHFHGHILDQTTILAQQFKQTDIAGDVGKSWNHFVRTGQVWAFGIGVVLGYMVKTFTSFG